MLYLAVLSFKKLNDLIQKNWRNLEEVKSIICSAAKKVLWNKIVWYELLTF